MVDAQTALLLPRLPDGAGLSKKAIADQFHPRLRGRAAQRAAARPVVPSYHLGVVSNLHGNLELCLHELGVMR